MEKNLRLRDARREKGLTQQALAEAVGVTRQTIHAVESGEYNPTSACAGRSAARSARRWTNSFGRRIDAWNGTTTNTELTIRYRIAFRALKLTLALILANGLVNTFHPWAPPLLQAVALLLPPSLYFFHGLGAARGVPQPQGAASAGVGGLSPGGRGGFSPLLRQCVWRAGTRSCAPGS